MTNNTFVVLCCVIIRLTSRNKLVIVMNIIVYSFSLIPHASKNFGVPKFSVTKNFGDF